jgi:uncharacterized protein (TIGR00730 family)
MRTLRRVCVFCGSSSGHDPVHREAATSMGRTLAAAGVEVVYGGGAVGLMGVIADAAMQAGGRVIGVLPKGLFSREVGHEAISEMHHTTTMHERKALMYELSDAFVALPGGLGTLDELFETLTWAQLGLHRKPVGLLDVDGYFADLLRFLRHTVSAGFVKAQNVDMLVSDADPAALLAKLTTVELPALEKWITPEKI